MKDFILARTCGGNNVQVLGCNIQLNIGKGYHGKSIAIFLEE